MSGPVETCSCGLDMTVFAKMVDGSALAGCAHCDRPCRIPAGRCVRCARLTRAEKP